jgi:hypothetical protein
MRKPKTDAAATEVECGAWGGGYPAVRDVAPGRRIYSARFSKCGGKGQLSES